MKKTFLLLFFSVSIFVAFAQNNTENSSSNKKLELIVGKYLFTQSIPKTTKYTYCTVCAVSTSKLFDYKVSLIIDFGQPRNNSFLKYDNILKNADGEDLIFNSIIDGINYLGNLGWEIQQVYVIPSGSDGDVSSTTYYLLKRYICQK